MAKKVKKTKKPAKKVMGTLEKQERLRYLTDKAERYPTEMRNLIEKEMRANNTIKTLKESNVETRESIVLLESVHDKIMNEIKELG